MESKEINQNLIDIVKGANSEDPSEVLDLFGKELANRIHQELETKKVDLATDLITKVQLDEGARLKKLGKHLKKHKGKYALAALGLSGAIGGAKKLKGKNNQSSNGGGSGTVSGLGSNSKPKKKRKNNPKDDLGNTNATQANLSDPNQIWKL